MKESPDFLQGPAFFWRAVDIQRKPVNAVDTDDPRILGAFVQYMVPNAKQTWSK